MSNSKSLLLFFSFSFSLFSLSSPVYSDLQVKKPPPPPFQLPTPAIKAPASPQPVATPPPPLPVKLPSPSTAPPPAPFMPKDCPKLCGIRCGSHRRPKVCIRACKTCCLRCKCVPPGTYGNREKCGKCYTNMTTHGGRPKCP